jgi:hypothetical protein
MTFVPARELVVTPSSRANCPAAGEIRDARRRNELTRRQAVLASASFSGEPRSSGVLYKVAGHARGTSAPEKPAAVAPMPGNQEAPSMERLTAEDQLMLWPDDRWPQDIGALAAFDGVGPLLDLDGRFRIEAARQAVAARLHLVPRFRQVLPGAISPPPGQ